MSQYTLGRPAGEGQVAASIKVRVTSGCFHREHSPQAYRLLDDEVRLWPRNEEQQFDLVEHESGPEILVYVAVATAGITLAKSVIDLVVAIVKPRSDGIRKGDKPSDALEVVVRRSIDEGRVDEEIVIRLGHLDRIDRAEVQGSILRALERLLREKGKHDRTG